MRLPTLTFRDWGTRRRRGMGARARLRPAAVEGRVVESPVGMENQFFNGKKMAYDPIFTHFPAGGSSRAGVGAAQSSFDVAKGDTATIRAIPGRRGNVRMDSGQGVWFVPLMPAVFAAAAWLCALVPWGGPDRLFYGKAKRA